MKTIALHVVFILFVSWSSVFADTVLPNNLSWFSNLRYDMYYRNTSSDRYSQEYFGYYDDAYTGYYLGTIGLKNSGDNSGKKLFPLAVKEYLSQCPNDAIEFEKYEIYNAEEDNNWNDDGLAVTLGAGGKSGTWAFANKSEGFGFYAVKGALEMALYFVWEPQNSGKWTTQHIRTQSGKIPSISHLTGIDPPVFPVPEPGSMTLLFFGLLGIVCWMRARVN